MSQSSPTASAFFLAASTALAVIAMSIQAQDSDPDMVQQQIDQLDAQIQAIDSDLAATLAQVKRERAEINRAERAILEIRRSIGKVQADIHRIESELSDVEDDVKTNQNALFDQQENIKTLLRALYVNREGSALKLILSQEDPAAMARNLIYHSRLTEAQRAQVEALKAILAQLEQAQNALARVKLERIQALDQLEEEQSNLVSQQDKRQKAITKLTQTARSLEAQKAQLIEDRAGLEALLSELDTDAIFGDELLIKPFSEFKGKLSWPTKARLATKYNSPRNGGLRWQGVKFRNTVNDPVSAIYTGRVVFADWLTGYGLLVILDHGDNYMSLYAHNAELHVEEGEWVETGKRLADAGNTGGQTEPGLYFEIRHKGEPINPANWCR